MSIRMRGGAGAALVAAAALVLAGCVAAPDPAQLERDAQGTFDALVQTLSETDTGILRTVEVAEPRELECAGEEARTQTAYVTTAALSVTADETALREVADALADAFAGDEWDRIRVPADAPEQRAWAREDGIVATIDTRDSVLVAGVFLPCSP